MREGLLERLIVGEPGRRYRALFGNHQPHASRVLVMAAEPLPPGNSIADDNGPLALVPLTAVAAVASRIGWLDDERLRRMLVLGAFSIFSVLMAREAVAAIDRLRGTSLAGVSRLLAYGVFAAAPTLWN